MKKILDNVPKIYADVSHNYMFPDCMDSLMRYLGEDDAYDFIFFAAVTGDLFTQVSNIYPGFSFVDSLSNERLAQGDCIGKAFTACGYDFKALNADEIKADKEKIKKEIVKSIDSNLPVLSFGIIGPPTCSLICGYEDDGNTLYGWAQFQTWEGNEPTQYFRKENGLDEIAMLILVGDKKMAPSLSDVFRRVIDDIKTWSILPDDVSKCRSYGIKAYKSWANALLIDEYFNDKANIAERIDAHQGMFCITATNMHHVSNTMARIKNSCPDMNTQIERLMAVFDKQKKACDKIYAIHGGFEISDDKLMDRKTREQLSAIILELAELQEEVCGLPNTKR